MNKELESYTAASLLTFTLRLLCLVWVDRGSRENTGIEFLALSTRGILDGLEAMTFGLNRTLARLFDLERLKISLSEIEDWEEADDARRWRCICVGSTFAIFADRAKSERT
jgi:hypothetical protein